MGRKKVSGEVNAYFLERMAEVTGGTSTTIYEQTPRGVIENPPRGVDYRKYNLLLEED